MVDRTRGLKDLLWILIFLGMVAIGFRLYYGLGATTNLTDEVPWGLWKILNMVAGVALATSGFTIGFLVYVLRIDSLRPMVKPAILIAFLGYGSSCFALFLDIGIPLRIWHAIVMWNEHSFLFEVAWCVMLYFTVTVIELSPSILERLGLEKWAHTLHKIGFGAVVVGISLSSLHHSSLGSLFLVTPQRLHPLWFTPRLPFLFILSAAAGGLMVAVLAKLFHSHFFASPKRREEGSTVHVCAIGDAQSAEDRSQELSMLRKIAFISSGILVVYLALKAADLFAVGAVPALLAMTWESYFYLGELALTAVLPLLLMLHPKLRNSSAGLATIAGSVALGLTWNRLNVGIFGYFRDAGEVYLPSLTEWAVSLGVFAAAGMVFLYACEYLPIFDDTWRIRLEERFVFLPSFDRLSGVWSRVLTSGVRRTSAIAVIVIALAWAVFYPPFSAGNGSSQDQITPPLAVDTERAILTLDGNRRLLAVTFPHKDHQDRLGGEESCNECHHLSLPNDNSTPCSRCHEHMTDDTNIFNHAAHLESVAVKENLAGMVPANHSCGECHTEGVAKQASTAVSCLECHETDMKPSDIGRDDPHRLKWASSYKTAMHKNCIACHLEERERVERPDLAECSNCHEDRLPTNRATRLALSGELQPSPLSAGF